MPDHPNAASRRAVFRAYWDHGDMAPMLEAASPDHVWSNDEGAGPWRRLESPAESMVFAIWWAEFFDGTFRHELLDVCASDDHVIEVLREVGEKTATSSTTSRSICIYSGPDGRYTSVQTFDRDREAVREFWSHFPDVLALDVRSVIAEMLPMVAG